MVDTCPTHTFMTLEMVESLGLRVELWLLITVTFAKGNLEQPLQVVMNIPILLRQMWWRNVSRYVIWIE